MHLLHVMRTVRFDLSTCDVQDRRRIAFYCLFAAGLLVLLLGGWISESLP
jgi:hypothetical protein